MTDLDVLAVHHGGGIGGAPVSLIQALAALRPLGIHGRALFTEPGPIAAYAEARGVPAQVVPTGGAFFYSAHARLEPRTLARFLRTFPSAVTRAQATLRAQRPDVLHLNTSVLLAWAAAARRERVPVVWTVREVPGPWLPLRRWHTGFILRRARRVVAISHSVREAFPPDARVEVVHNAVDLDEFSPRRRAESAALRASLGLAPEQRVVMAIGSVQLAKGHWLLLEAFTRLLGRLPGARLVLVCGGADAAYADSWRGRVKGVLGLPLDNLAALLRDARRAGVADHLVVTGFRPDVARVLAAADVVVFPSLLPEGFGRPLLEGMASGLPVVATHVGPSAEILGPGAGLLVQPDPDHLAHALYQVLSDADLAARLGATGRARAEHHFSLARQAERLAPIYREAAGG